MDGNSYSITQKKWWKVRRRIRSKWSKIEPDKVEFMKNNMDLLKEQLQATYGYTKSFAQDEVDRFMNHLPEQWFTVLPLGAVPASGPFDWLWSTGRWKKA